MRPERVRRLLWIAAGFSLALGTLSSKRYLGNNSQWADAVYSSLQLFTLNFSTSANAKPLPVLLGVLRFVAPAVTASAVVTAFASYAQTWADTSRARRMKDHYVVLGDSPAAIEIAAGLAPGRLRVFAWKGNPRRDRRHVVLIAESISSTALDRLRRAGVRVLLATCESGAFTKAVHGAVSVLVACERDTATLRWAVAANDALQDRPETGQIGTVQALLGSPVRADLAERVGLEGIEIASLIDRVAQGAITLAPPMPGANAQHTVVVASGAEATALTSRLWSASRRGGDPILAVFGPTAADELDSEHLPPATTRFDVGWRRTVSAVVRYVAEHGTTQPIGNPMYIWTGDSSLDIEIALSIVAQLPGTRAVVISDSVDLPRLASKTDSTLRELSFVGLVDSLACGQILSTSRPELVAAALFSEHLRFGAREFESREGRHALSELTVPDPSVLRYSQYHELARDLPGMVEEAGLRVGLRRPIRLTLTATEIRTVALQLRRLVHRSSSEPTTPIDVAPFFELAARLPAILDFVGLGLEATSTEMTPRRLDAATARRLAALTECRYQERFGGGAIDIDSYVVSPGDANLTQVLDLPLKLALVGYDIVESKSVPAPERWLDENSLELLAELEHRRWCRDRRDRGWVPGTQRDNERLVHPDLVPYRDLSEATKDKDRMPILDIPSLLAEVGLTITSI